LKEQLTFDNVVSDTLEHDFESDDNDTPFSLLFFFIVTFEIDVNAIEPAKIFENNRSDCVSLHDTEIRCSVLVADFFQF
jgi:hypothetical protein